MKFVVPVVALLCAAPLAAEAQSARQEGRVKVYWAPGAGHHGYESATIEVRFRAMVCGGDVVLHVALDPASIDVGGEYHYKNARYFVHREPPPVVREIPFRGHVTSRAVQELGLAPTPFSIRVHSHGVAGCLGQTIHIGTVDALLDQYRRPRLQEFLDGIDIAPTDVDGIAGPLQSAVIEAKINRDELGDGIGYNLNPEYGHKGRRYRSGSSSSTKLSDAELERRVKASAGQALLHEDEGDRYMALGAAFWPQAFAAYQKAQAVHYTDRVQHKIERIRPTLAAAYVAGKGIQVAGEGTAKVVHAINAKTPMFGELEISWRTATDGESEGWGANFRFGKKVYLVAGLGRQESQLSATIFDESDRPQQSRAVTWRTTFGELGTGLALRFLRHFDVRIEGVVALGVSSGEFMITDSERDNGLEDKGDVGFDWGYRGALSFQIPSTPLALAVHYKSLASKFSDDPTIGEFSVENGFERDYYDLNISPSDITTYHYVGVSLGLRWRKKR